MKLCRALPLLLLLISGCSANATPCEGEECDEGTGLPSIPRERDRMRLRLEDGGAPQDDGSVDPDGGDEQTDAAEPIDEQDGAAGGGGEADAQVPPPDSGSEPDGSEPQPDAEVPAGAGPCEICDATECAPGLLCMNLPGDSSHTRRCFPPCSNDDQAACTDTFGAEFQCWADGACSPVYPNQSPYWFDQNCDLYLGN